MKNTTKVLLAALAVLVILVLTIDAAAVRPYYNTGYSSAPAMNASAGHGSTGAVSGRLTTSNTGHGLGYAYIAIVNASNLTEAWYETTSDANGYFQFPAVNNTFSWNPVDGGAYRSTYKVYANHSLYGEGYSNPFPVQEYSTAPANLVIISKPAQVVVNAERNNLEADDTDRVLITAFATDVLGDPVPDGTVLTFEIDSDSYDAHANGSLSTTSYRQGHQSVQAQTSSGRANVTFGWVDEPYSGNSSTILSYYSSDSTINGSTSIYFSPSLSSWFGSVQDSFGKPYGGANVTLHLMGDIDGVPVEYYSMTTTSFIDLPYPGSYVFDNIEKNTSITYGYASAEAEIGDGIVYYGKSNNYTLNKSRTSRGFIVLHVPMPDQIRLTADPEKILVGGDRSTIAAQLYYNGKPYKRSGVTVTFFSNNDTIAYLPSLKTNVTDSDGRALISLTSNNTKGNVTVTGYTMSSISKNLTDSVVVDLVGWGTISGVVTDRRKNGIPNATVKLWTVRLANGTYENVALVKSPENPQYTVSRPEKATIGTFTYYRIPTGVYNITAEKSDSSGTPHIWFAWVNLTAGTATNNVALPEGPWGSITTPTPTPVVRATPILATPMPASEAPTPMPASTTPAPGFEVMLLLASSIGAIYLAGKKKV